MTAVTIQSNKIVLNKVKVSSYKKMNFLGNSVT